MEESGIIHFLRNAEICMGLMLSIWISSKIPIQGAYDFSGYLWIILLGMLTILNFSALAIHLRISELNAPIRSGIQAFRDTRLLYDDMESSVPEVDIL